MGYEFLEHTADVKFRAFGTSLDEMFVSAAGALNETIRGEIKILEQEERSFGVEAEDLEGLLYAFLEEFLVLLDCEGILVAGIREIEILSKEKNETTNYTNVHKLGQDEKDSGGFKLRCVVVGDKADNYKFTNDVKAVTFSEMFVREGGEGWECQVVLDV